jgi:hypothetical protein
LIISGNKILVHAFLLAAVFKLAQEQGLTPPVVRSGFRSTGLYPLDRHAIDESKLIGDNTNIIDYCREDSEMALLLECDDDTEGTFRL